MCCCKSVPRCNHSSWHSWNKLNIVHKPPVSTYFSPPGGQTKQFIFRLRRKRNTFMNVKVYLLALTLENKTRLHSRWFYKLDSSAGECMPCVQTSHAAARCCNVGLLIYQGWYSAFFHYFHHIIVLVFFLCVWWADKINWLKKMLSLFCLWYRIHSVCSHHSVVSTLLVSQDIK